MSNIDKIQGRNPVIEALKSNREIDKIVVAKGSESGSMKKIMGMAKEKGIPISFAERKKLDQICESHNHQGVIAYVAAHTYVDVDTILDKAKELGEEPFVIILDEITDPHNLGSIIRTADAVGAHGVIIPKRRSVGLTSTVAKTSAGAIEYVPVSKVSNISSTIDYLKDKGLWIAGAHMKGEVSYKQNLKGSIGLVIGSEGKGISRLVKEKCDFLVKLPMKGQVSSLNASVAASVLMYEVVRQREFTK
ncbi:MAG: 23S rRNA (guanosine(2251)-2'-O)-methyltransferase RlmB [Anaeromicrobium sp.]|jgi:23S rRNA (guanosine2251-2'-O)-methyltransferase|uniref:23S rRNA (guanosine(2251)-2'-O)-methyltransferase RlmB n=1 Tax=Anaeromicrobium sp. TaxID=1929132 RepID=UPI0025FAE958|nr:23S rRNA (guanosine(2251)-2'-O)-methyltransferase RlmB [Anaeromicrobium sp.]MCT4594802.1 23S rRNA (guanosine(2251)-2'-O)-methyltransferase RlmB [Anaeromicrobium sp.]